jgi:ferrous iron transport protein B
MVAQVLQREAPTCLVLTMTDELRARGGSLNFEQLEAALGIPVIGVVGHKGIGVGKLRELLSRPESWSRPHLLPPRGAQQRAGWADSVLAAVLTQRPGMSGISEAIDRVVLHPVGGVVLFTAVMVTFFQLIFAFAQPAMDMINVGVGTIGTAVHANLPPGLLADFIADGMVAGVGAVVIFLPQIVLLFSLLYLLEDIGYMARAAFVIDRVMGRVGLEGRAFVALLSSYACAVPGIMATRSIPSPRHRLVTILVAPLMTCSARLPVYALLIGAFVPARRVIGPLGLQGLVLLGLYVFGALVALAVASLLTRTLLRGDAIPFYMELPPYRIPTVRLWASQVWTSTWAFLRRAGTIILATSIVLWVLLTFPRTEPPADVSPGEASRYALEHSFAGSAGRALEPLIAPLGFDWKIGVGLIASLAAREVIVATLAQIYATADGEMSLQAAIRADTDPRTGKKIFDPPMVAALLVFFVFALQCMSTLAIMKRETNSWRWPAFAFGYLLVLAYGSSFVTHRVVAAFFT